MQLHNYIIIYHFYMKSILTLYEFIIVIEFSSIESIILPLPRCLVLGARADMARRQGAELFGLGAQPEATTASGRLAA